MQQRPYILNLIALAHLAIAFGLMIQIAIYYDYPLTEFADTWFHLTYLNRAIFILSLLIALAALQARSWLWHALAINTILILWNHVLIASWGINYNLAETMSASAAYMMLISLTMTEQSRRALLNPHLHWWKHRRTRLAKRVLLQLEDQEIKAHLYDISSTGAYIRASNMPALQLLHSFLTLKLQLSSGAETAFHAEVVRVCSENRGQYPAGLGVRFRRLTPLQRIRLFLLQQQGSSKIEKRRP